MKLILNWSKQQWLGMDAYQKSAVNFWPHFVFKLNATSYLAISSGLEHS